MSSMPFFAADTLGMTLYQMDDHLESSEIRPIRLGPWQIDMKVSAISDVITAGRGLTFWVTLGLLKFYLIVRDKDSWMFALDSDKLNGLTLATVPNTVPERLDDIEPAIKRMYHWDKDRWIEHPMDDKRWWWR